MLQLAHRRILMLVVGLMFVGLTAPGCQYSGSFEEMRCAQASDCPADSRCVEGYCIGDDASGQVTSVELEPRGLTLTVGQSRQLSATPRNIDGEAVDGPDVIWRSTNPQVVSVDSAGLVEALEQGTAVITAYAEGAFSTTTIDVEVAAAASVELASQELDMLVGESQTLSATVLDEAGEALDERPVSWSSSDSSVVVVDADGRVTALGVGDASVSAQSGQASATVDVAVSLRAVDEITLTPSSLQLVEGEQFTLRATVRDSAGQIVEDRPLTWTSSDEAVVEVEPDGQLTAMERGSATVAAAIGDVDATAQIEVVPTRVASVELTPRGIDLQVGRSASLIARPRAADGTELTWPPVDWTSSEPTIASVDDGGMVTGVSEGTVVITAEADGLTNSAAITVVAARVDTVTISQPSVTLEVGSTTDVLTASVLDDAGDPITDPVLVWDSADTSVVVVDASGDLYGLTPGTTTVTATAANGASDTANVEVEPRSAASVELQPAAATIEVSETLQLDATVRGADGTVIEGRTITWSSAQASVADVTDGLVEGKQDGGPVTITASVGSINATTDISVEPRSVTSVDVAPQATTLTVGGTESLSATARASDGTPLSGRSVDDWTSGDPGVADVDSAGQVTATGPGTTLIRATVAGQVGLAAVIVEPRPVDAVTVEAADPADLDMIVGDTVPLSAELTDANGDVLSGRQVNWSSDDPAAAVVDSQGQVTAVGVGGANITATSEGISGSVAVSVDGNTPPVADDQTLTTSEDTAVSITLTATDPDGQQMRFAIISMPNNGYLSDFDNVSGDVTYTPNSGFTGTDTFEFQVNDTQDATDTATITVEVQ